MLNCQYLFLRLSYDHTKLFYQVFLTELFKLNNFQIIVLPNPCFLQIKNIIIKSVKSINANN